MPLTFSSSFLSHSLRRGSRRQERVEQPPMVRKETDMRLPPRHQGLEVEIPSYFLCPISLNVMRSPVSLCTGITYDRTSIQRWFDSGNITCPATMLPLPSTDLVPNLTLRSIMDHWAASAVCCSPTSGSADSTVRRSPAGLILLVASSGDNLSPALRELVAYLSNDDVDDFIKNALVGVGGAAETVASVLRRKGEESSIEVFEVSVWVLAWIIASDGIDDVNKKWVATGLGVDAAASARSLARVMRGGSGLEARIDAARVAEFLITNATDEAKAAAAESSELMGQLIRLISPIDKGTLDRNAVDAGLSCLAAIAVSRRAARYELVHLGAVRAVARALRATTEPGKAFLVLQSAVSCTEGRSMLCDDAEVAVPAVIDKMMKASRDGSESAVAVLWVVCHRYRDQRALDAAAKAEDGLAKLLLVMRSGCSPEASQMAMELLKIYKVNPKSCVAGYNTKTTHIMPF